MFPKAFFFLVRDSIVSISQFRQPNFRSHMLTVKLSHNICLEESINKSLFLQLENL